MDATSQAVWEPQTYSQTIELLPGCLKQGKAQRRLQIEADYLCTPLAPTVYYNRREIIYARIMVVYKRGRRAYH
jgi:hypothetical protein